MTKRCGRSPDQATFGRAPRLPSELLSDETNVLTYDNVMTQAQGLVLADTYRLDSLRAFIDEEQSTALATALRAKTVLRKEGFEPGQKVGYWREQGPKRPSGKRSRRAGYVTGTFAGFEPNPKRPDENGDNGWVITSSRLNLVTREQMRHAQGFEGWQPDPQDLKDLKLFEKLQRAGAYEDAREPGPTSSEAAEPLIRSEVLEPEPDDGEQPLAPPPIFDSAEQQPVPASPQYSLTDGEQEVPPTSEAPSSMGTDVADPEGPPGSEGPTPPSVGERPPASEPEPKRPRTEDLAVLSVDFDGAIGLHRPDGEVPDYTWRGGFHDVCAFSSLPAVLQADETHKLDRTLLQEVLSTEAADSDTEALTEFTSDDAWVFEIASDDSDDEPPLSRKEQKALEREIPWREIANGPKERFRKYVEATRKEVNAFHHWKSVEPLTDSAADAIYRDPKKRKRILRARMAYRNKNAAKPNMEELANAGASS